MSDNKLPSAAAVQPTLADRKSQPPNRAASAQEPQTPPSQQASQLHYLSPHHPQNQALFKQFLIDYNAQHPGSQGTKDEWVAYMQANMQRQPGETNQSPAPPPAAKQPMKAAKQQTAAAAPHVQQASSRPQAHGLQQIQQMQPPTAAPAQPVQPPPRGSSAAQSVPAAAAAAAGERRIQTVRVPQTQLPPVRQPRRNSQADETAPSTTAGITPQNTKHRVCLAVVLIVCVWLTFLVMMLISYMMANGAFSTNSAAPSLKPLMIVGNYVAHQQRTAQRSVHACGKPSEANSIRCTPLTWCLPGTVRRNATTNEAIAGDSGGQLRCPHPYDVCCAPDQRQVAAFLDKYVVRAEQLAVERESNRQATKDYDEKQELQRMMLAVAFSKRQREMTDEMIADMRRRQQAKKQRKSEQDIAKNVVGDEDEDEDEDSDEADVEEPPRRAKRQAVPGSGFGQLKESVREML